MTDNRAFFYVDGIPVKGAWIDLDTVTDTDDVLAELERRGYIEDADEYGGDLLVADAEGLARAFLHPSDIFDLDAYHECANHSADDDAKLAYMELFGDWDGSDFDDRYRGEYRNVREYAEELIDDTGMLDSVPEHIARYFDVDTFAHDLSIDDISEHRGHIFSNC